MMIASAGISAIGSIAQGEQQAAMNNYNAQVQKRNIQMEEQKANRVEAAGEAQAGMASQKTKAEVGAIVANEAAGGIDTNTGSALTTQESKRVTGSTDALNIRTKAAQDVYNIRTEQWNAQTQANIDEAAASNDITNGFIGAGSSILGKVSTPEFQDAWSSYQASNGLGG